MSRIEGFTTKYGDDTRLTMNDQLLIFFNRVWLTLYFIPKLATGAHRSKHLGNLDQSGLDHETFAGNHRRCSL